MSGSFMSGRLNHRWTAVILLAGALFMAGGTARTANDVDAASLKAARALIGATIKTAEFETMLRQVVQNFSADVVKRTDGADDKVVVRALMEQAGVTIAQNRGLYLEGIAHIYARHLTARELRAAAAFFSSPEGRQYTKVQGMVSQDTVKYAVAMGGTLKPQIVAATMKSLQKRGYKPKKN